MKEILAGLADQQAELDALIAPVTDAAWATPSRCEGWTVYDVVLHLAQTNEMALASVQHRMDDYLADATRGIPPTSDIDETAAALVAAERGAGPEAVYDRWRRGVDALTAAFDDADAHDRVQWVAGTLSVMTLATTRLAETWIHTHDVAHGLGVDLPTPNRLKHVARLAWRTLPYAFARAGRAMNGSVAFELAGPDGEPWVFGDGAAATVVRGPARDLCEVAGQRANAADTSLTAEGPDAAEVLQLVRTFA